MTHLCTHLLIQQALFECLKSNDSLQLSGEEKIVALTSTLEVFCYLRPQCDETDQRADALGHFIFMYVLWIEMENHPHLDKLTQFSLAWKNISKHYL